VNLGGGRNESRNFVRIDITDTGKGMSDVETRRLFEPFYTTKSDGTGLGLATVYRIVEAYAGRVFVESTPGIGTRFSMLLPAGETGGEQWQ
jgi:two-component system sensor histidine kinase PilS (NtrC family)